MPEPNLAQVQQWIASVLTTRGALSEKLHRAEERLGFGLDAVVAAAPGASAEQRLDVYVRGYALRLVECLREEYPALHRYLGDSVFDAFAKAYLLERPSRSPSLFELGAGFSQFLAATRPARRGTGPDWLDLPANIARLERARSEAARSAGPEGQGGATLAPSISTLLSGRVWLRAPACLRLVELQFVLSPFLALLERGPTPAPPEPGACVVAISRRAYQLTEQPLSLWQCALLDAARRAQSPLTVVELARRANLRDGLWADLALWLPVAESLGFVEALNPPCAGVSRPRAPPTSLRPARGSGEW